MKYGMRERLSGAVILIALAVIFVPMLFDEPAPREERPEPSLSIDAPIDVERHDVPEPEPPAMLAESASSDEVPEPSAQLSPSEEAPGSVASGSEAPSQGASSPRVEPAVAEGEWTVQVGSFGEPANAERLLAQLRDEGFSAYSRPRGNNLTTVYVGPFDSSEAGERAVTEVKARVNLQGLLVRVKE